MKNGKKMIRISLIILVYTHISYGRLSSPPAGILGQRLTSKHVAKYLPVQVTNPSTDVTENSPADIVAQILPVEDVIAILPADNVAQILPVDEVAKIVEGVTQFVVDVTKLPPTGGLLGDISGTASEPLANLITAPCALVMLFLTSLLPTILAFLIPVIQSLAPSVTSIVTSLAPTIDSIIDQVGPAIFPIIKPFIPSLIPVFLRLLPHFIADAPEMVPSLLQSLLGVQNVLPAALPAP